MKNIILLCFFLCFALISTSLKAQNKQETKKEIEKFPRTLFSKDSVTIIYWEKNYVRATNKIEETEKRISFPHKIPANEIYYGFHLTKHYIPISNSPCNLFSHHQELTTLDSISIWNQKSSNTNIVNLATFDVKKLQIAFFRQLGYLRSSKGLKQLQPTAKLNQAAQTMASYNYSKYLMQCYTSYGNPTRPDLAAAFKERGNYYFESDEKLEIYNNEVTYDVLAKKILDYEMKRKRKYNFLALNTVDFVGFGTSVYETLDSCKTRMATAKLTKPLYNANARLFGRWTIYETAVAGQCGNNLGGDEMYSVNYYSEDKRISIEKYHLEYSYATRKKLINLLQKYNPQAIQFLSRNYPSYFVRPKNLLAYYYQFEDLSEYAQKSIIEYLAKYETDQNGDFLEAPYWKGEKVVYKHTLEISYAMIFKTSSYKENVLP